MRSRSTLESTAGLFAALGDRNRLKLVKRLCDSGPSSITNLAEGLELTRQAVTKHLRVLEKGGLVTSSKAGREQIFSLEQKRFSVAQDYIESVSNRWDNAINRLKAHLGE